MTTKNQISNTPKIVYIGSYGQQRMFNLNMHLKPNVTEQHGLHKNSSFSQAR